MERNWGELLHFIYTEDEKWHYSKGATVGIKDDTPACATHRLECG